MNSELARAVLTLNRLQSENNAGASHDLEPAQGILCVFPSRLMSGGQLRDAALGLRRMEYTRTCLSGLFELDLWHDRSDPEGLYGRRFGHLGAGCDPALWAPDSFRYIDCMTIFAYTLGQSLADGLSDGGLTALLPELAESASGMTLGDLAERLEGEVSPHERDNHS